MNVKLDGGPSLDTPQCAICYESVKTPIQLKCGHVFDYLCISAWWRKIPESSALQTCPLDRILFSLQEMEEALFHLPEAAEFRNLMENYDSYHNASAKNNLGEQAREENERNRQAAYAKVDAFVKTHPEFMDFLPINWF